VHRIHQVLCLSLAFAIPEKTGAPVARLHAFGLECSREEEARERRLMVLLILSGSITDSFIATQFRNTTVLRGG